MYKTLCLIFCLLVAYTTAEVIDNIPCSNKGADGRNIQSAVHEIRVMPCAEAADGAPCKLRKGTNATIEIDFTPTKSIRRPQAGMYWISRIDMRFPGLNSNPCEEDMTCPVQSGTRYTYSANIPLGRDLPAGQYPIKLKVFRGRTTLFCQTLKIKLMEPDDN